MAKYVSAKPQTGRNLTFLCVQYIFVLSQCCAYVRVAFRQKKKKKAHTCFTQANVQMQTCTQVTGIAALSQTNNWIFDMWWNDGDGSAEPPLPEMQQSLFKMKRLSSDESPAYEKSNTAAASVSHCSNMRRLKSCWKSISAVIDWGEI